MSDQRKLLQLNQAVRISNTFPWAKGECGIISLAPSEITQFADGWIGGYIRRLQTPIGEKYFYWITLDSPQMDDAGDGPYTELEIESAYIQILDSNE